ncbi:MAG: tetratricopeptide repeat protein [Candidatus Hodarchaeales archaeon]|jgi:ATP/maltotriose-dependent transcriptional regulator MalT
MTKRSDGPLDRLWRAEQLIFEGKIDEARPLVESLEKEVNLPPDALLTYKLLRGQLKNISGDYQDSIQLADQVLKDSLEQGKYLPAVDANCVKAAALIGVGDYEKSLIVITQGEQALSKIACDSPTTLIQRQGTLIHLRGRNLLFKGDFNRALEHFQKSLALFEELNNKHDIAMSLRNIGVIYAEKGDLDKGLEYHQKALNLFREVGNKYRIAWCLTNIASFLSQKGEFSRALEFSQQGFTLYQELGNKLFISYSLGVIGSIYEQKGELDQALEYCQKKMLIDEELGNKWHLLISLALIALIHIHRGELDQALEYQQQRLRLAQEIENENLIADILGFIGFIYWQKGDLDKAIIQMEKSVTKSTELGMDISSTHYLFLLVSVALDKGSQEKAQEYLQRMQFSRKQLKSKWIDQEYRLAEAMVLKASSKIRNKVKAQEIFKQVTEEKTIHFYLTEMAMVNLCELLLDELKAYGEVTVLQEAKTLVHNLYTTAQEQHSFSSAVNALILQAKFAMIEGNLTAGVQFLDQALLTAEENNLGLLSKKAAEEKQQLEAQFDTWRKYIQNNVSLQERLKHARVTEYLEEAKKMIRMQNLEASS